jgi:hypothetical protein
MLVRLRVAVCDIECPRRERPGWLVLRIGALICIRDERFVRSRVDPFTLRAGVPGYSRDVTLSLIDFLAKFRLLFRDEDRLLIREAREAPRVDGRVRFRLGCLVLYRFAGFATYPFLNRNDLFATDSLDRELIGVASF